VKILYTATVLSHICQFHLPHIKVLKDKGNEIHIAARDNLSEKNGLTLKYADKFHPVDFRRSPFDFKNLKAYKQLSALLKKEKFDFIICNTPVGGILTRLAARNSRKQGTKVIYIAHGFHFYKGAPKKNWLIYYPIEKVMAKLCDTVVTITKEDFVLAKSKFKITLFEISSCLYPNFAKSFSISLIFFFISLASFTCFNNIVYNSSE
jgi:glycosyltransferase EpsD